MAILIHIDVMMARQKMSLSELAERIDIAPQNLSVLKTGKAKALRFETLNALCRELKCQPGDILKYSVPKFDTSIPRSITDYDEIDGVVTTKSSRSK